MISRRYCYDNNIIMKSCHTGPIYYSGDFWNRPREILHCPILIFFPSASFYKIYDFSSIAFVPLTLFSLIATVSTSDYFYGRLELGSLYPSFKSNANYFLLVLILSPTLNFMGTLVFLLDRFYFVFERLLLAKHRRYSHTIAIWP